MKAKLLKWQTGWIWDSEKFQRVANWIDLEAVIVWQEYNWTYQKK